MSKLTSNELSESLNELIDEKLNTEEYSLMTENKTIVGAINEIYGKEIIANAIGDPLNRSDTFTEMSNDINNLLSTFKTNMINNGVAVESGDKFKQLIDKIVTLADNEDKGIKYAEGAIDSINISDEYYNGATKTIDINIDFNPTMIVICGDISNSQLTVDNVTVSSTVAYDENTRVAIYGHLTGAVVYVYIQNITQTSFDICVAGNVTFKNLKWYAIGVGEKEISKGMQYASGNGTISSLPYNSSGYQSYVINTNLDFTPTVLFWTVESLDYKGEYGTKTGWKLYETANSLINVSSSTCLSCPLSDAAYDCNFYLSNINSESFTLNYEIQLVSYSDAWTENVVYHWYAIGEEDTTLNNKALFVGATSSTCDLMVTAYEESGTANASFSTSYDYDLCVYDAPGDVFVRVSAGASCDDSSTTLYLRIYDATTEEEVATVTHNSTSTVTKRLEFLAKAGHTYKLQRKNSNTYRTYVYQIVVQECYNRA